LTKLLDELLELGREERVPHSKDLRTEVLDRFWAVDRAVWVQAHRFKLEAHLPPRPPRGSCIGKTNLPGYLIPGAFRVYGTRLWRNDLLALRELVAGTGPDCARHSLDYRSVRWCGTDYTFTSVQAACVKLLWEAWENGTPELGQATILEHEYVGSESSRLVDLFKKHPAWQTMIVSGTTSGSYRLAECLAE
jgi:hypothetical protein